LDGSPLSARKTDPIRRPEPAARKAEPARRPPEGGTTRREKDPDHWTGEVLKVLPKEMRAIVQGVNTVKRHTRATARAAGGILEQEAPIHLSNLAH
jgi:hypothetical protein